MEEPLFNRPFALSIGPQRAASTWIDRYLRARGDVCLPRAVKEIYFFNRYYDRGADFYRGHFCPRPHHRLVMEVTAQSFDCAAAPVRVRAMLGADVRLVCPLRHPVARSYSLYLHYRRYGIVSGSLREAVAQCPQILSSSAYATHLARWQDIFGEKALHLLYQEDLERDADGYVSRLCDALRLPYIRAQDHGGVRCNGAVPCRSPRLARLAQEGGEWLRARQYYTVINAAKAMGLRHFIFGADRAKGQPYALPPGDLAWLAERLDPEIERFEKLTGRRHPGWHTLGRDDVQSAA